MCDICEKLKTNKFSETQWVNKGLNMSRWGEIYFIGYYEETPRLKEIDVKINYCPFCGQKLEKKD